MAGSGLVRVEMQGNVRVLWLLAPPGNLFGPALCAALDGALQAALTDAGVQGVVIASGLRQAGQGFSGGIDLADLGWVWPADVPAPADIARRLMGAQRPVIAALHGPTLGAGAEIALAAQGRVATPDLRFGLRDLLVGRLPMAGATQNLPRLIGATEALRLMAKGISVSAGEAVAMGIVDAVTEGDLLAAACAMALDPPIAGRSPGLRDGRAYLLAVAQARKAVGPDAAVAALVDCVEAAQLLPHAQGLDFEAEAAAAVAARPEAAALQHLMGAEMRLVVDLPGGQPAGRIGLWGAATWPLILPALQAGLSVVLADDDRAALLQAVEKVALLQEDQVVAGRLTAAARDEQWGRLRPTLAADGLTDAPLVVAARAGAGVGPGGVALQFGAGWGDGPRLELVAPGFAELQLPADAVAFGRMVAATLRLMRLRLVITHAHPVASATADGGGVARAVVLAAQAACRAMMRMGVRRDDIVRAIQGTMRVAVPAPEGPSHLTAGPATPDAIRARLLGAVAATGARLLAQGAIRRGGAFDALACVALGMPRHMGGPLFAADQRGLLLLRRDLQLWQADDPVWAPHPSLDDLVSAGKRLSAVDADTPA